MNSKFAVAFLAGAVACGAMAEGSGWAYNPGEGLSYNEDPVVKAEFGLSLDSKYMTYGCVDGKDPILTPSAKITFADWMYFGLESIFDVTKGNGKRGGYGNRAGEWTTLDAIVGVSHGFELNDDLTLNVDANYIYEYIRRYHSDMGDTQYLNLEIGLEGLLIEPTLAIERDLMADDGTYVNFSLAHTFDLVGEGEDAVLTFTPSIGQGFGDKHRTRGYELARDHGGLMDTTIMGEFEYTLSDNVTLGAYLAYSDYWFDSRLRDGAREYNSAWGNNSSYDNSWNIYGGVSVTVAF
ncbi:MAG: hypothetical protein K6F50_05315 [Kiritimatiellae bacterium]|nr:hypothetical protein [Kiritimatiellia bacterium]